MASKIDIISNALILIGDTPINSLTGNDRRQVVASNLYDNIKLSELSKHYWGFAQREAQLAKLVSTPTSDRWNSIYQLPTDLVLLINVYPNVPYKVVGKQIYTNLNGGKFTVDYVANVPESEWPPFFVKMMEYALAKDFATSIRDSASARAEMTNEYVNASRMARFADSQQRTQVSMQISPFTSVRY